MPPGRHRRIPEQGPASSPYPHCQTCGKDFRKWGSATSKHMTDNPGHVLVTLLKRSR